MRYISILVGSAGGENPADNVTSSLFAWWEWVWYGGRVSPSFRAWNGNTFTHKQTQTFWRTYCHVHNFKFDTALQVICFAHFLYHSVHNNFIFGPCVCTSVSGGLARVCKKYIVCTFVPFVSLHRSHNAFVSYGVPWHATQICCWCARVCDSNRRRHYAILYSYIL